MKTIKELEHGIETIKQDRKKTFEKITKVESKQWNIINDNFISVTCKNLYEVAQVLNNLRPFKNGWEIKHKETVYINSLYRVDINNGFHNRELKIQFTNASGCEFWVKIDFKDMPEWFRDVYFTETTRHLYDTEQGYVNIPSHCQKYKRIRKQSYEFWSQSVSWYGGDKTIVDEKAIYEMIEEIKTVKHQDI